MDALVAGRVLLGDGEGAFAAEIGDVSGRRVLADNYSAGYVENGTWTASSLAGHDGRATRWGHGSASNRTATWTAQLPEAGSYLVEIWYPADPNSTLAATYEVVAAGAVTHRHLVDQTADGSLWRPLGVYDLDPTTVARILCERTGHHRLNAVRFSRVEPTA